MITSTSNQRIKEVLQFQRKAKARNEAGIFIVEGLRMFLEVPAERVQKVYVSESFWKKKKAEDKLKQYQTEVVSDTVFSYMSDTKTPQGILCIVKQFEYELPDIISAECPHILMLDNLQDPGNLGTIIRTAEGAGVTGILMSKDCVDIYNPKVIRSTMGSVYRMPFLYIEDVLVAIEALKKKQITIYAAHLDGEHAYDGEDYKAGSAFLIGNEGAGLRQELADKADTWVRIPMQGEVESLNAAIAATVLMFEVSRQRGFQ